MNKRRLTLAGGEQPRAYRATTRPAMYFDTPLLTLDRAIDEGLSPASLRQVADINVASRSARRLRQADNLYRIADRLELLGYGRKDAA